MKEGEDKLKIVDEGAARKEEEEVVRLDMPRQKPIRKQGKMSAEALRPVTEEEKQAASASVKGVSGSWVEEYDEEKEQVIPIGWFFLVGLVLLAVVAWMILQILSGNDEIDPLGADGSSNFSGTEDLVSVEAREQAREHFEKIETALAGFLGAESIEERAEFVRHPSRVIPLMEDYYAREEFRTFEFQELLTMNSVSLDMLSFMAVVAETKGGTDPPVLLEDTPNGILVDWESFICYQPISPEEFAAKRPSEPISMRVYGTVDNFYVYQFSDETKYGCVRLEFRDSDVVLFGYVERGSVVEQKFNQIMGGERRSIQQPFILRLRFPEDCPEERCVLIEDIESALWAYPENPAEKAELD